MVGGGSPSAGLDGDHEDDTESELLLEDPEHQRVRRGLATHVPAGK